MNKVAMWIRSGNWRWVFRTTALSDLNDRIRNS